MPKYDIDIKVSPNTGLKFIEGILFIKMRNSNVSTNEINDVLDKVRACKNINEFVKNLKEDINITRN